MTSARDECKKLAAVRAMEKFAKDGFSYGIGSGTTIQYAIQYLADKVKKENWQVKCVPTSFQARQLIIDSGLYLSDLERSPILDLAVDGADEVDENLNCIKGGGACLTQEKIVAVSAKVFVVIADYSKQSNMLCTNWKQGIPIEVISVAYAPIKRAIEARLGGEARLRIGINKAGPLVTDNGNFVLDWLPPSPLSRLRSHLASLPPQLSPAKPSGTGPNSSPHLIAPVADSGKAFATGHEHGFCRLPSNGNEEANERLTSDEWLRVHAEIKGLPGVLETGLFVGLADYAFFGQQNGTVVELTRPRLLTIPHPS